MFSYFIIINNINILISLFYFNHIFLGVDVNINYYIEILIKLSSINILQAAKGNVASQLTNRS